MDHLALLTVEAKNGSFARICCLFTCEKEVSNKTKFTIVDYTQKFYATLLHNYALVVQLIVYFTVSVHAHNFSLKQDQIPNSSLIMLVLQHKLIPVL